MTRSRILYLVHQYGHATGVELHTQMLVEGLADRCDVSVAWPDGDVVRLLQFSGGTSVESRWPVAPLAWPETPYRDAAFDRALDGLLEQVQPDLIHVQHFLFWPLNLLDRLAATGARIVVSFHDYFAINPQYAFPGATDDPQATVSPEFARRAFGRDVSAALRERREHLRRGFSQADALITVSDFLQSRMAAVFPLSYQQIEYGIRTFEPLPKVVSPSLRFGFLGQCVPLKGLPQLLEAFAVVRRRHPQVELHCFGGDRPDAPAGVTFHGPYQAIDLPRICASIDVGVVPSIFPETWCMVLSELWQGRVPAAVSKLGALRDRVQDGVNGKTFDPGDPASMAAALNWFIECDEWRNWSLPQPRSSAVMVEDYDALYRTLLLSDPAASQSVAAAVARQDESSMEANESLEGDNLLIVQTCEFAEIGDVAYRLTLPSQALATQPGITVIDCDVYHRLLPALTEEADVLIINGLDAELLPLLERRRQAGRISVFEANDFYPDVQPWNPRAHIWRDRSLQDTFYHLLREADGVQTSTPELARRWRELTDRPVAVFRNQLTEVPPLRSRPQSEGEAIPTAARPLTIGWGGSPGHLGDWYQLAPALQKWLDAHPQIRLAVMTGEDAQAFFRLPPERYHFQPFGTLSEYLRFVEQLDIGLAPLLPTDFNRCRSDVKFLEYASRGVAGIYADLEPYHDSVEHGRTGFLYRSEEELFEHLDALVADASLRERIGRQAYEHVSQTRRLEDHIRERQAFYQSLLSSVKAGARHPERRTTSTGHQSETSHAGRAALLTRTSSHAERHGHYLALHPEEPEQILRTVCENPAAQDSLQSLIRLVRQHPDYTAARVQLGRRLNDAGQYAEARHHLETARQQAPDSSRIYGELARIHHMQRDFTTARQLLETAVRINPREPQGWQFLLRLLGFLVPRKAADFEDAVQAVEQARRWHPCNYPLALLGARLLPPALRINRLNELLTEFAPTFAASELPLAGAAFSEALGELSREHHGDSSHLPQLLPLLRHAVHVFPQSVKLADQLAQVLRATGDFSAASAEMQRAELIRLAAQSYRAEFPAGDPEIPFRQIAASQTPR